MPMECLTKWVLNLYFKIRFHIFGFLSNTGLAFLPDAKKLVLSRGSPQTFAILPTILHCIISDLLPVHACLLPSPPHGNLQINYSARL